MYQKMETPDALAGAIGADNKTALASEIIADFTGEVHSADLILIALDATEYPQHDRPCGGAL